MSAVVRVSVPSRDWYGNERMQAAVRRMLWEKLLLDLGDEWSGFGKIVASPDEDAPGVVRVTAEWTVTPHA